MTFVAIIAAVSGLVLLGCAARRAPRKPDVGWDVKDPKFAALLRRHEGEQSGMRGRR